VPAVRLQEIVDALETQVDEQLQFLDLDSGQVKVISRDILNDAEENDEMPDLPKWQEREWQVAKRIHTTDRFRKLPTKYDVHEWSIMEEFSLSVESDRIREDLLNAIHGSGAFRYFKDTLRRHRIEKHWYAFRSEALREIAIEWCEEEGIEWEK
jgi:hypothetical protein